MYRYILANLLPCNDFLIQNGCSSSLEDVALLLLASLVRLDVTSLQCCLVFCNNCNIHIRSRTQIIEDTGLNCIRCKINRFLLCHLRLPLRLKHRHRSERTTSHSYIGQLVRTSMRMNCEETNTCGIDTRYNKICTNVSLVSE